MRIALDATYSVAREPSGVAVYSREILSGLAALYPKDAYVHCYRWKQWRDAPFARRLLIPPFATFRADIFHGLNQRVDNRPSRRVVCTFHDLFVMTADYSTPEFRERFTKQARRAADNADAIIAVSTFTARQVETLLNVPSSRIRVIPHGVHVPYRLRGSADPPYILSVGTIQTRKNTGRLVRAFEFVPPPWRLVLAGAATGHGAAEILHEIEKSKSADRIEVTGYVTQTRLAQLYASAALFAFPSLAEGFGIPVLEAMANGVPVLTSNSTALTEVAGDAALLVDPERTDDIAHGLLRLTQDATLREQLTVSGVERAKLFTWETALRSTRTLYAEL